MGAQNPVHEGPVRDAAAARLRRPRVMEMRAQGLSLGQIAQRLNAESLAAGGPRVSRAMVARDVEAMRDLTADTEQAEKRRAEKQRRRDIDAALARLAAEGLSSLRISQRLAEEGRFIIPPSTISSRLAELRRLGRIPRPDIEALRRAAREMLARTKPPVGAANALERDGSIDFVTAQDLHAQQALREAAVTYPETPGAILLRREPVGFSLVRAARQGAARAEVQSGLTSPAVLCATEGGAP